jgi:hypothetical protein
MHQRKRIAAVRPDREPDSCLQPELALRDLVTLVRICISLHLPRTSPFLQEPLRLPRSAPASVTTTMRDTLVYRDNLNFDPTVWINAFKTVHSLPTSAILDSLNLYLGSMAATWTSQSSIWPRPCLPMRLVPS